MTTITEDPKKQVNIKRKLRNEPQRSRQKKICNRKGDDITLMRMHQETMVVLKDINTNIARVADAQEAFLDAFKTFCLKKSET